MSFRTRRVLFMTPVYIIFQFFLLKYAFLLFGGVEDICVMILALLIGLLHAIPMFFEERKSTIIGRFFTTIDGIWLWASLMFLIDVLIIYILGIFTELPMGVKAALLAIVPILGIYNYYSLYGTLFGYELL